MQFVHNREDGQHGNTAEQKRRETLEVLDEVQKQTFNILMWLFEHLKNPEKVFKVLSQPKNE